MAFSAVNWNRMDDDYTKIFWDQNVRQFWVDEEIPLADDKLTWMTLTEEEKRAYEHVLGGLTLLDTEQGSNGMPLISRAVTSQHQKGVLGFMGAMEHMHAKSYSSIYSTLSSMERIDEIFDWVLKNEFLQDKITFIHDKYAAINNDKSLYLAMATSVFLETFLFYSGFFYPLYLAGQGKLINSGEIINLIIRDESVHGVYVGLLAQDVFKRLTDKEQVEAEREVVQILEHLQGIEQHYTTEVYSQIGLIDQVMDFTKYNGDKAMMNLGFDAFFNVTEDDINPIVINGLRTDTKNHDFFSTKGNGYIKTTRVEALKDEDFIF
ncbi:class 1b ribonucleoside-diphosphate reductase subunit beta [Culicoidibacter larvae]|uniref:Ribonucleoside-diphosphate reductase subunit beta n=1 Tax=Culicoidibacter larvae TaxID=2579976 RepID=A0A5R8QFF5_9FIRM|nr:class 1b ribonucleoside-diphosphate reductase subunit beta [Culicoidibacter larvae]TLG76728.1 class 1b ribonucleoside-diphosphate reductase subunit beta [Culicoidibacter larvae]